jgi:hypothetical protein
MPYRKHNIFPKYFKGEMRSSLASFIYHRILVGVLHIDILFILEGKEALPTGKKGIV